MNFNATLIGQMITFAINGGQINFMQNQTKIAKVIICPISVALKFMVLSSFELMPEA